MFLKIPCDVWRRLRTEGSVTGTKYVSFPTQGQFRDHQSFNNNVIYRDTLADTVGQSYDRQYYRVFTTRPVRDCNYGSKYMGHQNTIKGGMSSLGSYF